VARLVSFAREESTTPEPVDVNTLVASLSRFREPEWQALAEENGAAKIVLTSPSNLGLAIAAAEAFLGDSIGAGSAADVTLPGRLERRGESPLEIWDGAHNLAGVAYLLPRLPEREYVLVSSILEDKRPDLMLEALSVLGRVLVATQSSNTRSIPAGELAIRAERYFDHVETVVDPAEARRRALALAGPDGGVLVSGSLYLLSDLSGIG